MIGWVGPPEERLRRVADAAGLEDLRIDGWSVTALEFEHGGFRLDTDAPIFFVRELVGVAPPGWSDDDRQSIDRLRHRVTNNGRAVVRRYRGPSDGQRIVDLSEFERVVVETLGP